MGLPLDPVSGLFPDTLQEPFIEAPELGALAELYGPVEGEAAAYVRAATRSVAPESEIACVGSNHVPGCAHLTDQGETP